MDSGSGLEQRKESRMSTEFYGTDRQSSEVAGAVQTNWVPLSLIGVGIAWLVASNTGLAERVTHDDRVQAAGRKVNEFAGELGIGGARSDAAGAAGTILGPDGEPLSGTSSGRGDGWVHQA